MMGIKERRFEPLPREISLEDLVPKNNFYRRLEATLDLSFVREMVRPLYARGGRPSVDPVVFFKLQLVMFFEGLRSERELMRVAADRLSVRWYLGYDLHEPLPDHSSLTRTRERFGLPVFRLFFERIVEECVEAGLVRGNELFFDSTKVEGNAAVDSLAPRWAVEAHLAGLFEEGPAEDGPPFAEETDALPSAGDALLREQNAAREDWISRDGAQDRSFKGPWRERTSDTRASRTDPDATPMTWAASGRKLGYQAHYVVDGGKARIVLNALVAPAEVTENRPMLDLLWRTCFRWKLRPHHVTADGKYGTLENVVALEEAGVRAYVALHESGSRPGFFAKGEFRYDAEADVYSCPAGKVLRPLGKKDGEDRSDRVTYYRARAAECAACPLKPRCTTNKNGRQLRRYPGERHVDRVRSYRGTPSYEKALRKRKVWVEPLFAEAKDWHGMRKFRLRTLRRVNAEALLVAAGQNLKRLLRFGDRRPRKLAQAAALRPPPLDTWCLRRHRSGCSRRSKEPVLQHSGKVSGIT
ncbi:MAG: IS1182 family transposase [Acidobacteriota bacterium]|nr:IS1182 family transposase [Acidobacteriota bacterium]